MAGKTGGLLGSSIRASNVTNRIQSSKGGSNHKPRVKKLDRAVPPAELFSAFGMPVASTKSFLIGYEDLEAKKHKKS